ncbi:MAG: apbE 3 [Planctomycetaceae bacterium]|nr:apbE 3 [Planctomycetaceae bacterium]
MDETPPPSRRDFLSGRALQQQLAEAGDAFAEEIGETGEPTQAPAAGPTIRLSKTAMACDFEVILNPGAASQLNAASSALELIDKLEDQLSVYRPTTELSRLNQLASQVFVEVEPRLFELLELARRISGETRGGFDITAGPLIALWRRCKAEHRLPTAEELESARQVVGIQQVEFDTAAHSIHFPIAGMEFNLGSIGKGYALDRAAELLIPEGVDEFLLHGGKSSLLGRGGHNGFSGWPIGIANPLFPEKTLATILLEDAGLSTSGSNIQYFRLEGRRFGHILDPRTGWPCEGLASVTVIAPTATLAEALSTAFFVIGVENAQQYCHNHSDVKALLIPWPASGQKLQLINCGVPDELLFL